VILIDFCGWLEFLSDGPLADQFAPFFAEPDQILTPTIVLYGVVKKVQREAGKEQSRIVAGQMNRTLVVPLDARIAFMAADISLVRNLPMADAIVYATACAHDCQVITSDQHFRDLPEVICIKG